MDNLAVDVGIYHNGSSFSAAELADYELKLREAITANGNFGVVEYEVSYISVYGDGGGDNKRLWTLLVELCWKGDCCLECYSDDEEMELHEMTGEEIEAMLKRLGIE